jgi:omega-6 fatty acid desaturase (delta-12 desaturase)
VRPPAAVTLGEIRSSIAPDRYARSRRRALGWLVFDAAVYAATIAGAVLAPPALSLAFGVLAGFAVSALFVWAHDAGHGALFRSRRWSEVLATIAMLPSLHAYRLWDLGHNKVHHGFTSLSSVDWIWRPMTPDEYRAASKSRRVLYRLERHPATCGLHYLVRVWWPGMVTFRSTRSRRYRASQAFVVAYAVALTLTAWRLGGSWLTAVSAVVVPFAIFTYVIALVVYLHHTHPETVFFTDRHEWRPATAQLSCSTVVRGSRLMEALSHHILVHVPHHVDTRIPFYRLPAAYDDLRAAYGDTIIEYRLRPSTVVDVFRHCQLFDPKSKQWYRFGDVVTQESPAPGPERDERHAPPGRAGT